MFIIALNSNNVVQNGQNSTLVYKFPNSVSLTNKYIAVSSVSMYYSWFNISSLLNNNTLSYTWTVGSTTTTYTVVIPDGLYEVSDINNYLQFTFIQNGTYLINGSGDNVYYAELVINLNRLSVQLNTYYVPTSLPSGYSAPSNFVGYPTTSFNPVITIPTYLSSILGYAPINGVVFVSNGNVGGAYTPPTAAASNYWVSKNGLNTLSYLSNTAAQVQPNSSVYISLSNINNPYAIPSSIIYAIQPSVAIGSQIIDRPPNFMWNKLIDGTYTELRLQILGLNYQPIVIQDPNMTILLTIRDKDEAMGSK